MLTDQKFINAPLTGQTFGETSPAKMLLRLSRFYNLEGMNSFRIVKSVLHQVLYLDSFRGIRLYKFIHILLNI